MPRPALLGDPDTHRLAITIGPAAAWVTLTAYVLTTAVMHLALSLPFLPAGPTNVVGALGALAALWRMRCGHPESGARLMLAAILLDLVADMFLNVAPYDEVLVFIPSVIVVACLLLGPRDAIAAAAVLLLAVPLATVWNLAHGGSATPTQIGGVVMTMISAIGVTILAIVARRAMLDMAQRMCALAERLATMIERAPDGIILLDGEGRLRHANPVARGILSKHPMAEGDLVHEALLRHDGEPADVGFLRAATGQLLRARVRGTDRDLAITGAALELGDGETALELMVRDVTARARERRSGRSLGGSGAATAPAAATALSGRIPASSLGPSPAAGARRHVLVADDDDMMRRLVARQLELLGWRATICASGSEALALLAARPSEYDLLLSDVQMPGLNGAELARLARGRAPQLPIVLMSGDTGGLTRDLHLPGPPFHMIAKPFDEDALGAVLHSAVAATR